MENLSFHEKCKNIFHTFKITIFSILVFCRKSIAGIKNENFWGAFSLQNNRLKIFGGRFQCKIIDYKFFG